MGYVRCRTGTSVAWIHTWACSPSKPWSRNLGDGVRELRFHLHPREMRITYWLASGRRVVLLTVFRKTRMRETRHVERAKALRKVCESEHEHARINFGREIGDDD
ncbi:type II toxin-antitoxin system RelE/ParE family toxin [Nocardia anaemiae]|uniref:type II toxin-antitoxin system RelE/ParE family toxin n=1 Tax=Nocardia anaemiae TaxID=263910 RepID=UPI001C3FD5FC|nr:type II toxin-antitoxin system RelE/ParE family toxin [Nocardia anaemiae]